ncbi:MAG: OmpA family protein [Pseudomonadota bacterium]
MKNLALWACSMALLAALPGTAAAEAEAGENYFSIMGTYSQYDDERNAEDDFDGGQLGIGRALNDRWNIEGLFMLGNTDNTAEEQHYGVGLDLQRVFARASRFSPYAHAGVGGFRLNPDLGNNRSGFMTSAGLGFYLDLFSSDVALRGEWRHRWETASSSTLDDDLFSLGLQFPFGAAAVKVSDSDGDGVNDSIDRCPGTPAGTPVDAAGCELDDDGDGVVNSLDQCPATPMGVRVDARGCPLDSDGDGVSDDRDECPNTVRGASVDERGCELDTDGDGVVDRIDECPETAAGVQVDIKGCEIRAEIVLRGVNFESNSDRLLPGATRVLDDAAASLNKYPSIRVEVGGHTDSDGAAEYNESLSERRALTVRDYLASKGVALDRMTVRGYGETQPVADNSTASGKADNRRVVLRILER